MLTRILGQDSLKKQHKVILTQKDRSKGQSSDLAKAAIALEEQYAKNCHQGSRRGPALIEILGANPILISCPHAVNHPRNGKLKLADTFTGPIGIQLAELTKSYALIYARTTDEDPNYDNDGPYKKRLAGIVRANRLKFVLDVHGISRTRPMQIAIGTAQGRTVGHDHQLIDSFTASLRRAGFTRILVDEPNLYDASRPATITSHSWRELRIPALQIEIQRDFRDPEREPHLYTVLLFALKDAIQTLRQHLLDPNDPVPR